MKKTLKTKDVAILKQISPLEVKIRNVKITSPESMSEATEFLSQVNKFKDKITEEKEKITKPLNEALKEVRGRYKPAETIADELIGLLRTGMSKYQTQMIAEQREREAKILEKVESGKIGIEKASEKMAAIVAPEKTTSTDQGSVTFREDKVLKVVNLTLIPHEYFDLNERRALDALKAGQAVPGCEIELVQVPINRR